MLRILKACNRAHGKMPTAGNASTENGEVYSGGPEFSYTIGRTSSDAQMLRRVSNLREIARGQSGQPHVMTAITVHRGVDLCQHFERR
jgi:hypothetical protein